MSEPVEFCGELKTETELAYCVFDGANTVWLPKSITKANQIGGSLLSDYEFIIPEWLAKEKEII